MEERIINGNIMISTDDKTAEISQPRKRSLNLNTAWIRRVTDFSA
jgi:hypothetical protein